MAENMYEQVNPNGYSRAILYCILDFNKDATALSKADMYFTTKQGILIMRQSNLGWKLLIRYKDGS